MARPQRGLFVLTNYFLEGPANKLTERSDIQTIYLGPGGIYRRH